MILTTAPEGSLTFVLNEIFLNTYYGCENIKNKNNGGGVLLGILGGGCAALFSKS